MADIRIVIEIPDKEMRAKIARLVDIPNMEMKDAIGALVVSQTQRRIDVEKTAPDGTPWKPNHAGSETLVQSGALRDTIDYDVSGDQIEVGSPLIYAGVQHFGAVIVPKEASHLVFAIGGRTIFAKSVEIPARPFLGISAANENEIENEIENIIRRLVS